MKLQELLRQKGSDVYCTVPEESLAGVAKLLMQHRCGSAVVLNEPENSDSAKVLGIITERDILRACAEERAPLAHLKVQQYMSADIVTGGSQDEVRAAMGIMTQRRIRHLPIVDGGRLVGLISIGDLVKAHYHETQVENHYLKSYIQS